jgi:RNA-splicing ligase RtcB
MNLNSKHGEVKIFTENVETEALRQIQELADSELGESAHLRIMPDVHAGKGCVIGTTLRVTDKICPNIVGVDISCGVTLVHAGGEFHDLHKLDKTVRANVPNGMTVHSHRSFFEPLEEMKCWHKLSPRTKELATHSLGTLGGGNHFIEAYKDGYISVHSGSRNIGYKVAEHYQERAYKETKSEIMDVKAFESVPKEEREAYRAQIKNKIAGIPKSLAYLKGEGFADYVHDIRILDEFAIANRNRMLESICKAFKYDILDVINSTHNYIDTETMILRKGAIRADKNMTLVIPMNMRDGLLVCKGKGNSDWNYSAPHGAGRLYSRSQCRNKFTLTEFKESMTGIFTTCIGRDTIDEAPFVYKNFEEIIGYIEPTVKVLDRLIPIYNFKAGDEE